MQVAYICGQDKYNSSLSVNMHKLKSVQPLLTDLASQHAFDTQTRVLFGINKELWSGAHSGVYIPDPYKKIVYNERMNEYL